MTTEREQMRLAYDATLIDHDDGAAALDALATVRALLAPSPHPSGSGGGGGGGGGGGAAGVTAKANAELDAFIAKARALEDIAKRAADLTRRCDDRNESLLDMNHLSDAEDILTDLAQLGGG